MRIPRGLNARTLIRALLDDGFSEARTEGSHHRFKHPDGRGVTVAYSRQNDTFTIGTLRPAATPRFALERRDGKRGDAVDFVAISAIFRLKWKRTVHKSQIMEGHAVVHFTMCRATAGG